MKKHSVFNVSAFVFVIHHSLHLKKYDFYFFSITVKFTRLQLMSLENKLVYE